MNERPPLAPNYNKATGANYWYYYQRRLCMRKDRRGVYVEKREREDMRKNSMLKTC